MHKDESIHTWYVANVCPRLPNRPSNQRTTLADALTLQMIKNADCRLMKCISTTNKPLLPTTLPISTLSPHETSTSVAACQGRLSSHKAILAPTVHPRQSYQTSRAPRVSFFAKPLNILFHNGRDLNPTASITPIRTHIAQINILRTSAANVRGLRRLAPTSQSSCQRIVRHLPNVAVASVPASLAIRKASASCAAGATAVVRILLRIPP